MVSDNKKILTVCFLLAGALAGFIVAAILTTLAASFSAMTRFYSGELTTQGIPILVGLIVFAILQFNPKTLSYFDAVVAELKKVVWPSRKDTTAMTVVVCVIVALCGVAFGLMDFISAYLVGKILQ